MLVPLVACLLVALGLAGGDQRPLVRLGSPCEPRCTDPDTTPDQQCMTLPSVTGNPGVMTP